MKRFYIISLLILMLGRLSAQEEQVPYLISSGGDVQTDGFQTIHLALGEPVVASAEGTTFIGLGFLHAVSRSEPCPPEDSACICLRNPLDPSCFVAELDDVNFLLDEDNTIIPPPTLDIDGSFDLTVFNRWGKLEFSTKNEGSPITNWDGIDQNGEELLNGVYYYVLEHPGCKKGKCKGSLTVLRPE